MYVSIWRIIFFKFLLFSLKRCECWIFLPTLAHKCPLVVIFLYPLSLLMFTTAWRAIENKPFQLGMAQIKISLDVKFSGKSVSHYSLSLAWEPVNLSLFYCRTFESSDSQLWLHLGSLENFKNVASGDLNLIGLVWVSCTGIFKSTTGGGSKPGCAFCAAESCSVRELRKKRHACMWINVQRGVLEWFLFFMNTGWHTLRLEINYS